MGTPVPSKSREHEYSENIKEPKVVKRQLTEDEKRYYNSLSKPSKSPAFIESMKDINDMKSADKPGTAVLFSDIRYSEKGMEVMLMDKNSKITPPAKSNLIQSMLGAKGKTTAIGQAMKEFEVSAPTIYKWIHMYEIQFDKNGKVVVPDDFIKPAEQSTPAETMQQAEQESCSGTPDEDTREFDNVTGLADSTGSNIEVKDGVITGIEYHEDPNDTNELTLAAQPGDGQVIYPIEIASELEKGIVPEICTARYRVGNSMVFVDFVTERLSVNKAEYITFKEAAALVDLLNDIL